MYETILQETTGVKLFQEEEKLLNAEQYGQLCERMDSFAMTLQEEQHSSNSQICEIYFNSPIMEEQQEQFLITIEKKGKNKTFTLKRRNQVGIYGSEKAARLSKKQYADILKGSIEWMKESGKLLVNEFYHKIKLFEYRVGAVITCIRQELYVNSQQMYITVDKSIQRLFGESNLLPVKESNDKLAYVRVRCANDKQPPYPHLLEEWLQ